MTLDELQAEFPHGSRWHGSGRARFDVIVGWVCTDDEYGVVLWDPTTDVGVRTASPEVLRQAFKRIPDPVPCPIIEPVTLFGFSECWSSRSRSEKHDPSRCGQRITLHPAEPGATEGRYTWEQP